MLQVETGTLFLGYTKQMQCLHCNNTTVHVLRQEYIKQSVFFVPITNQNAHVHLKCPVCEKQERLLVSKFWSGKEKLAHVVELLESGKEYTKHQFEKMDRKEQEKLLKRLNALHAYSVVKFLGT